MTFHYYIRYYYGDDSTFNYKDVRVYSSTSNSISGVTFTPVIPTTCGGSEYNTGKTKKITYKALNASGGDTLGISWSVNEPILKKFHTDTWSGKIGSKTSVKISDLAWESVIESNVQRFTHTTYRVALGEYVRLSLPEKYEFNGFYATSDVKYLTVNYGYNKDNKKISLNSQVYSRVKIRHWNSGEGDELTPGTSVDVNTATVASTYGGPYSSLTYHTRSDAKTYQQLLSSIDTTRPNEDCSFQVSLRSDPEQFHNSETLNVSAYNTYQFNKWKTDSGDLNLSNKPSTSNVTVYADWTHTDTVVQTSLPQWTTTQKLQSGSNSLTLSCFKENTDTIPYFTKTALKYEFKPAKHVRWKVGSTNYSIGTVVTEGAGTTYTAVWEVDSSGTSTYEITDNVVTLPVPTKSNYSFGGWWNRTSSIDSSVVGSNSLLKSYIYPQAWLYEDTGSYDEYTKPDTEVFVAYGYLLNNQGVSVPVLYKTDLDITTEPDWDEPFYYVGTEVYQGTTYDKWRKIENHPEGTLDWTSIASLYVYTQQIVVNSGATHTGTYTIDSNVALYAVWKLNSGTVEIYNSATKQFDKYQIVIYNESTGEWDRYIPKIGNGSDWSDTYM